MLVKNTYTGEKIEKKTAFIVAGEKKNLFFDNEEQYYEYIKVNEIKKNIEKKYLDVLSPYISFSRNPSIVVMARRHIKGLVKRYDAEYLYEILPLFKPLFDKCSVKDFVSMKNKYLYLYKIISNQCDMKYEAYHKKKIISEKNKKHVDVTSDIQILKNVRTRNKENIEKFLED